MNGGCFRVITDALSLVKCPSQNNKLKTCALNNLFKKKSLSVMLYFLRYLTYNFILFYLLIFVLYLLIKGYVFVCIIYVLPEVNVFV